MREIGNDLGILLSTLEEKIKDLKECIDKLENNKINTFDMEAYKSRILEHMAASSFPPERLAELEEKNLFTCWCGFKGMLNFWEIEKHKYVDCRGATGEKSSSPENPDESKFPVSHYPCDKPGCLVLHPKPTTHSENPEDRFVKDHEKSSSQVCEKCREYGFIICFCCPSGLLNWPEALLAMMAGKIIVHCEWFKNKELYYYFDQKEGDVMRSPKLATFCSSIIGTGHIEISKRQWKVWEAE